MVSRSEQRYVVQFGGNTGDVLHNRDESYLALSDAVARAKDIISDPSKYAPLLNCNIEAISIVEIAAFKLVTDVTCTHNLFQWNDDTGEWEEKICQ